MEPNTQIAKKWFRKPRFIFIFLIFCMLFFYILNLFRLYIQLEESFINPEETLPTWIYSDVSLITLNQDKGLVTNRLRSLGYKIKPMSDLNLSFVMHPIRYPHSLIPPNHPTWLAQNQQIILQFDSTDPEGFLKSIQIITDNNVSEINELFLEPEHVATLSRDDSEESGRIRKFTAFEQIPSNIWKAVIAIEDQNYLNHHGFDPRGIARALLINLRTLSFAQGGSTITQQLIKNLMVRRTKNLFQKINEIFLSMILELRFSKQKILEHYLNEVYLGQIGNLEVHGVNEGAKYFFGKPMDELNLGEITLMIGLIRGPGYYSPYRHLERTLKRRETVLEKMVEIGVISESEAKEAHNFIPQFIPPTKSTKKAPYFTDFVKAELIRLLKDRLSESEIAEKGFRIYTSLDTILNEKAQEAVFQGLSLLEKSHGVQADSLEGALVAVDQKTGLIRSLIGGRDYSKSNFNRILNTKRQVGSTFKPFVFLAALEQGKDASGIVYGPAYPIEDAPWKLIYDRSRRTWTPENYKEDYRGWITLREALAYSINVATAKLGTQVGLENVLELAKRLGLPNDLPKVPSLFLGAAELSPVELIKAYATIANHGEQNELTVIRAITTDDGTPYARFENKSQLVVDSAVNDQLIEMLKDVFIYGTAKSSALLGWNTPAAGKTGTTNDHKDSWFAGFTPKLTTVVWTGFDQTPSDDELHKANLTGASYALHIWINFMKELHGNAPLEPFPTNPSLVSLQIDKNTGELALPGCPEAQITIDSYIEGQEPERATCEPQPPLSITETILHNE